MDHHEKLFVVKIDAQDNSVWIGDEKYLYSHQIKVVDPRLLSEIADGEIVNVKIRYQHKGSPAKIEKTSTGLLLNFMEPQRAVTPGQAAVFYRDKELVGGGWITL